MRSVILFIEVATPSILLGVITFILVMNMGCHDVETVQAVQLEETKMMTEDELNRELEFDIWCDTRKIEAIPYTDPQQFIITLRRNNGTNTKLDD